ncbi:MAG: hypothetical protein NZ528_15605 [Caldilineales bacterium]|nr:hypothetical protein [Caldilineales bacterium]MDW8316369.1 hypothetical protein [Anaerolineae bacterium]
MSGGNGKTNGDSGAEQLSGLFASEDAEMPPPPGFYVTFEHVINSLLWAATQNKLRVYELRSTLDIITLDREFKAYVVPQSWKPPYHLYAEISFYWPAEYSVAGTHGDEVICTMYHDSEEECPHEPGGAEFPLDIEVHYQMPDALVSSVDSDAGVEAIARRIRSLFAEAAPQSNAVTVEVGASFADDGLRLTSIAAHGFWALEEEMRDLSKVAMALLGLLDDVGRALKRFAKEFAPGQEGLQP